MNFLVFLVVVLGVSGTVAVFFWQRHSRIKRRILRDTTHLGPFVDLSLISDKGGMAKIYRATNSEVGRECVLKVLRSEMTGNAAIMKKFRNEADILRAIKSTVPDAPVVAVYSTGTIKTTFIEAPYIEMEYIPGIDLGDYLQHHPRLDPLIAENIVKQIVEALAAARGVAIHRDLKPGNVLLRHSDPAQAVVCDFGVAKDIDSTTKSQHAFGTASYMAPERCVPEGKVSTASDIYSLGVLWYRMLSGHLLFDDPNPLVVMRAHVERDPTPAIEKDIPPQFQTIISRMLSKYPEKRPTLDELREALVPLSPWGTIPIAAPDTQEEKTFLLGTEKPRGFFRRPMKIRVMFVVEFGVILAMAGVGAWFVQTRPASPPAISPQPDTPPVTTVSPPPVAVSPPESPAPAMGTLQVTSLPNGAEVTLGVQVLGKTPLQLSVPAGALPVIIRLTGHKPYDSSVSIVAARTTAVHATLSPMPGNMSITSNFKGAEIKIDGSSRGRTPLEVPSLTPGNYRVTAFLEGFLTQERAVEILPGRQAKAHFVFRRESGYLFVQSPTAPANIFINDKFVGTTPLERLPVSVGLHTIIARARGFQDFTRSIEILHDQEATVIVTLPPLEPAMGTLAVNVLPADSEVLVNGKSVGRTPLTAIQLDPGTYTVTVSAEGWQTFKRSVTVRQGTSEEVVGQLTARLDPGDATEERGSLSVNVTIKGRPAWGTVYVDNRNEGSSPRQLENMLPREYHVRVVRPGFRPRETFVTVAPGKRRLVTLDLELE